MLSLCYPCDEIRHGSEEKWKKEADLYLNSLFCNENQVISLPDASVGMNPADRNNMPGRIFGWMS